MKLERVQTTTVVIDPAYPGSTTNTSSFIDMKGYDITLEAQWVRVASRNTKKLVLIPLSNVSAMVPGVPEAKK